MLPVTILRITIFFKTLFFTYTGKENNSTAESLKSEWWIFVFNPKPFASKLSYFYLCEYEFGSVPELNTYGSNLDPDPQHCYLQVMHNIYRYLAQ